MRWSIRRQGERVVRDPIHGDIPLPALTGAIVGSLEFQRLRYVRQNGLLHFVFPGAVHTRFAHSLGTLANAQAVWQRLTAGLIEISTSIEVANAARYIGTVFELSALLHDVGHCAFSHSAERVNLDDGSPLFGSIRELFTTWGEDAMLKTLISNDPQLGEQRAVHEEIGLILIARLFKTPEVQEECKRIGYQPDCVTADVVSVLNEAFPVSQTFATHAETIAQALAKQWEIALNSVTVAHDLRTVLHSLVSGTLDVDRLDYLPRDAMFCGVPYGKCDREILIGSLEIVPNEGNLTLTLDGKAAFALDDLLWSRYQMFIQVYNHKTNVIMNHMLGEAISWAIRYGYLKKPRLYEQYVAFTDDLVMGTVFDKCSEAPAVRNTPFGRTLTRRSVPRHLGFALLTKADEKARQVEREALVEEKRAEVGGDVLAIDASSDLLKGAMPSLRFWEKHSRKPKLEAFANRSSILQSQKLGPSYRVVHFFSQTAG